MRGQTNTTRDFWTKVDAIPGCCWEWTGTRVKGYGSFKMDFKTHQSHVLAYKLTKGNPGGLYVRHLCNNKACCNPDHLELGTQADNMQDAIKADVMRRGSQVSWSKLTESDVTYIRQKLATGKRGIGVQLATELNVDPTTIYKIKAGTNWKRS